MAYAMTLIEKFGLFGKPSEAKDEIFDSRLTRIQTREARIDARVSVFVRNPA